MFKNTACCARAQNTVILILYSKIFTVKNALIIRNYLIPVIFLLVTFVGCKKSNSGSGSLSVEYQVNATNSSGLSAEYNNVLGNRITITAQNSYSYDLTVDQKPFTAYVKGSSTSPFSSVTSVCTVNILVNGAIVKTATVSSNTLAVAEATYIIQ